MTTPHGDNSDRLELLRSRYGSKRPAAPQVGGEDEAATPTQAPAAPLGGYSAPPASPATPPAPQTPTGTEYPQKQEQPPQRVQPPLGYREPLGQETAPTAPAHTPGTTAQPQAPEPRATEAPAPTYAPPSQPTPAPPAAAPAAPTTFRENTGRVAGPTTAPSAPATPPSGPSSPAPSFRAAVRSDEIDYFDDESPFDPTPEVPQADTAPSFDGVEIAPRESKATRGWKGWVNRNLGMSLPRGEDEIERDQKIGIVNTTIRYPQVVGFYGAKGGVGKSSLTQIIGSTISRYRSTGGGMVGVDIDANSSLLSLMKPNTPNPHISSVVRMARDRSMTTASDVNSHLVFNDDNFAVLPGVAMTDDNPVEPEELRTVLDALVTNYTLIGLDFPGSPEVPLAMQALHWLDYLVFVVAVSPVSIGNAKRELRRINEQRPDLVANATIILNHGGWGSSRSSVQNLDKHVQTIKNMSSSGDLEVFEVNYDEHLSEAARLELGRTESSSQDQFLNIAAHLISKLPKGQPRFQSFAP